MIPEERLRELLAQLVEKSKAGQVNWQKGDKTTTYESYKLLLPKSRLVVGYTSPTSAPDSIGVWLNLSQRDTNVARLNAEEDDPDWELLRGVFDEARRAVVKWDTVLKELEDGIKSDQPLGESEIPF